MTLEIFISQKSLQKCLFKTEIQKTAIIWMASCGLLNQKVESTVPSFQLGRTLKLRVVKEPGGGDDSQIPTLRIKASRLLLSSFLKAHLWCLEPLPTQLPWSYQAGESTLGGHREMKKYSRSPKLKLPAQMPDTWVSGLCTLSSIMTTTTAQTDPKKVLRCLIYKLLCFAQINRTRGKKPQERTTELGNTNSPKTVRSHTKIIVVLACFGISSYAIYIQNRL